MAGVVGGVVVVTREAGAGVAGVPPVRAGGLLVVEGLVGVEGRGQHAAPRTRAVITEGAMRPLPRVPRLLLLGLGGRGPRVEGEEPGVWRVDGVGVGDLVVAGLEHLVQLQRVPVPGAAHPPARRCSFLAAPLIGVKHCFEHF